MTRYVSTRGAAPALGFLDAALAGLAGDGGLYVPDSWPQLTAVDCENMRDQSYVEAAWRVLTPFVGEDIDGMDLGRMLKRSYSVFESPAVAPLSLLEEGHHLLELYHGPTFAFKDVALQFLGQVFSYELARRDRTVTIVGATSGDTGSAAIHAFAGQPRVKIVILHPKGRVSETQRRQMTTVMAENVHNIAIEGDFDDCQNLVKQMFADAAFRTQVQLSAINSINWARIAAQVVYYVTTSCQLSQGGSPVDFVVPTGNFGNIYAGYVARAMGAPVGRLVAATNRNDILYRFMSSGEMKRAGMEPSLSPSMDIQVSSNFERLLFDLYGRDGAAVAHTMQHFGNGQAYQLDDHLMARLREGFDAGRCDDQETLDTIADIYKKNNRLIDPHTAVGVAVARRYKQRNPGRQVVTLSTAHPAKFEEAVVRATGVLPEMPPALAQLRDLPEKCDVLPNDLARVQDHIRLAVKL